MKKPLLYFSLFLLSYSAFAQDFFIKECRLKFMLPNKEWKSDRKETKTSVAYKFTRTAIKDSNNKKITPEIVVIVENIKAYTDLTHYSIAKQKPYNTLKNFKIQKVFTESDGMLKLQYAVGNKATYEDINGVKHIFYFIHAVKDGKGIEVIMDVPANYFDQMEEEFTSVIRSLEYIR